MVLRVQVRASLKALSRLALLAVLTTAALSACTFDARRCEELRLAGRGAVTLNGRGCESHSECRPIAMSCGEWGAIRVDADRRQVTSLFERAESLCGCGGDADADGGPDATTDSGAESDFGPAVPPAP